MTARRTFAEYKSDVRHALGSPSEANMDIAPATIVNDALEHLVAMHDWQWLKTGEQYLSLVANQPYVELPADFGDLIAIASSGWWDARMLPITWDEMIVLRRSPISDWARTYRYVVNVGNVELGQEDAGLSLPTLELYPTPAESTADALSIVYRRAVRRMTDDADRPQIPSYLDRPFSLLCRAFARTDYEDEPESAYSIEFRMLIADAKRKDGGVTRIIGSLGNAVDPPSGVDRFYPRRFPQSRTAL